MSGRPYMSSPDEATWRSGYATVSKTVYTSSILVGASINKIKCLRVISWTEPEALASVQLRVSAAPGARRARSASGQSAGGVPTLGKRNQRPGQPIVVGRIRRLTGNLQAGQEVLLRGGRHRRPYGIQQSFEFDFAHRALHLEARSLSKVGCSRVAQMAQILSVSGRALAMVAEWLIPVRA